TPTYLSRRPELVAAGALVVAEGWVQAELPPEVEAYPGPVLWVVWDPGAKPPGWEVFGLPDARTAVRVVDARHRAQPTEAWVGQVPTVLFSPGPASALKLARSLSALGHVAYDHPGLPGPVRETLAQLFSQGRLTAVVCGGPVPEGLRGAKRRVWLGPTAKEVFLQQAAGGVDSGDQVTLVLAFGQEDVRRARAEWESRHPSRQGLAAVYRLLRDLGGEVRWPDDLLAQRVHEATGLDPRLAVPAALDVLEAAHLLRRERVAGGWRVQLCGVEGRKDLASVLRFAEGERSRAAFEAGSRWLVSCPALEVLEQVAAGSVAARTGSGAG
ncbi:MAG: hypothetical protein ACK45F_03530, partial [bacterium]